MGLLPSGNPITDSNDDGVPVNELKGWSVRFSPLDQAGGWAKLDDWEALPDPPTKTEFEINTGELDPGTYRLFWIQQDTERLQVPPDDIGWKLTIDANDADQTEGEEMAPVMESLEQLDRRLDRLEQGGGESPLLELVNDPKDLFVLMGAFDDEFVGTFGEQAALSQLGLIGGSELGFDEYKDNPIGAFFFDSYKEPQQLRDLGQNLGAGGSAFFDGLLSGAEDPESVLGEDIEHAEQRAKEAEERDPNDIEKRESRAGSLTLDDLGVDKPNPTEIAQTITAKTGPASRAEAGEESAAAPGESGASAEATHAEKPDQDELADADGNETEAGGNSPLGFDAEVSDEDIEAAIEEA